MTDATRESACNGHCGDTYPVDKLTELWDGPRFCDECLRDEEARREGMGISSDAA